MRKIDEQTRELERLAISMTIMSDVVQVGWQIAQKSRATAKRIMDLVERLESEEART